MENLLKIEQIESVQSKEVENFANNKLLQKTSNNKEGREKKHSHTYFKIPITNMQKGNLKEEKKTKWINKNII